MPHDFWQFFREDKDLVNRFPVADYISLKLSHGKVMRAEKKGEVVMVLTDSDKLIKEFANKTGCPYTLFYPASYNLHDPQECQQFVKDNQHLPGMPLRNEGEQKIGD